VALKDGQQGVSDLDSWSEIELGLPYWLGLSLLAGAFLILLWGRQGLPHFLFFNQDWPQLLLKGAEFHKNDECQKPHLLPQTKDKTHSHIYLEYLLVLST
jgi:hypothetical protein